MIPRLRVWDKKNEAMLHKVRISTYIDETMVEIANQWHWVEKSFPDVILMQSTGLKDKNGAEIYEGDIVNVTQYLGGHSFGQLPHVVKASECNNNLMLILQSKQRFIPEVSLSFSRSEDYEIIGNIWENPELSEVSE